MTSVQAQLTSGLLEPFGVAIGPDSKTAFVTALTATHSGADGLINEYSTSPSGLALEGSATLPNDSPHGLAISPNGHYLVAADKSGADVFSLNRMGQPAIASSSWGAGSFTSNGQGAIEVAISSDNNYVFVSLENSNEVAVFNLQQAERRGFSHSDFVGFIPLGVAPVGLAVSSGGRFLYATSELDTPTTQEGTLTTIDLKVAEHQPSKSVISVVWAGCSPVRVVATPTTVYVTARGSDALLQFSAHDLSSHPTTALQNTVQTGAAPVGLALVDDQKTIVIADSNRFGEPSAPTSLAVVSLSDPRNPALVGYVSAGGFTRDIAVSPLGSQLFVTDFSSGDVEELNTADLP